jgi:tetratricopeptide (TPR) repeat protein
MSTPQLQTLFGPPSSGPQRARHYLAILCVLLAIFVLSANTRQYWKQRLAKTGGPLATAAPERPSVFGASPALPDWAVPLDDFQRFAEARKRASESQPDRALAVFLYLAQKANQPELRAQGTLYAAEILMHQKSDAAGAEELYRYFLAQFPAQPGADKARYDLGVLDVEKGRLAEAIYLLTSVVAETPESPFASNAGLLAQQAALALSVRESRANYRLVDGLRSVLPAESFSLLGFLCYLATLLVSLALGHAESPTKRKTHITWFLTLVLILMSATAFVLNKKEQKETAPRVPEKQSGWVLPAISEEHPICRVLRQAPPPVSLREARGVSVEM